MVSGVNWKDKICIGHVPDCDQNLVKFTFSNGYSQWGGDANNGSENLIKMFTDDRSAFSAIPRGDQAISPRQIQLALNLYAEAQQGGRAALVEHQYADEAAGDGGGHRGACGPSPRRRSRRNLQC